MYANPPRRKFEHWRELIDDILFNELTIKEAALKWGVSQPAISQWLKKHPSIKQFYYNRPWVQKQRKIQFYPEECANCQELIDIIENDGSDEGYLLEDRSLEVDRHTATCDLCRKYQIEKRIGIGTKYRLDCPSISDFIDYIDADRDDTDTDTIVTRHVLRCKYCQKELKTLIDYSNIDPYYVFRLAEKEEPIYPEGSWRTALDSASLLEELIDVVEHNCSYQPSELMEQYCEWRTFRSSIS